MFHIWYLSKPSESPTKTPSKAPIGSPSLQPTDPLLPAPDPTQAPSIESTPEPSIDSGGGAVPPSDLGFCIPSDEESTSDGDPCLCGTCNATNTCVNDGGSRPIYFALHYTGVPEDAPTAISVQIKGKAKCKFLDIKPDEMMLSDENIYFVNISPCGSGGDFKVYDGDAISGDMIGYLHISCSDPLYIGLAFEEQEPSGFGPFTLIGSCFSTSRRDVRTPSCLGQCDGIIKEGYCTEAPWE